MQRMLIKSFRAGVVFPGDWVNGSVPAPEHVAALTAAGYDLVPYDPPAIRKTNAPPPK